MSYLTVTPPGGHYLCFSYSTSFTASDLVTCLLSLSQSHSQTVTVGRGRGRAAMKVNTTTKAALYYLVALFSASVLLISYARLVTAEV